MADCARSHLRRTRSVTGAAGGGYPPTEFDVALDIAAYCNRAVLRHLTLRGRGTGRPGGPDGGHTAQSDRPELPDHARSYRLFDDSAIARTPGRQVAPGRPVG